MPKLKRTWIILAVVVAVLLVGVLVVQHLLNAETYRPRIESALSDALGRPVQLGHLDFSLFSGALVAETPTIADDPAFSNQPFLAAKDVRIGVEMKPLIFSRQLHITSFTVDEPKITLIRAQNGKWNYSSLGSGSKRKQPSSSTNDLIPNLTVAAIDIKDGIVSLGKQGETSPRIYEDLDISAKNFSFARAFPFTLSGKLPGGGALDVSGNAGPINQQDASLTPLTAKISLKHADLVQAGLVEPAQGISGVADLDTNIASSGQSANATGEMVLTQLKLAAKGSPSAQPVDIKFSITQDLQSLSGKINNAVVQINRSTIALSGTYSTSGAVTSTQIQANGQNMAINDLVAFLPSLGVQLPPSSRLQGGTLTANLAITGPITASTISGPVRIANTQLAGFDLGQKLSSIQTLTGAKTGSTTTIQALSTNLRYSPAGTQTDNLAAVVAGIGSASGSGTVAPSGALNYRLLVKLSSAGVGGLATQAMSLLPGAFGSAVAQTTKNGIPVTIAGTTANPVFTPDLARMVPGATPGNKNSIANPLSKALGGFFRH